MCVNLLCQKLPSLRYYGSAASVSSFYDIVIVGGGLVGNAMACSIGQSPYLMSNKVLLLESGKPKALGVPPANFNNRVSAVSPASLRLFQKLGVMDQLKKYRMREVTGLYVMDGCSQSSIRFEQLDAKTPIAHIIENEPMVSALYDRIMENCPNVTLKTESSVVSCSVPADLSENAEVVLADGTKISTSLLIGADGVMSSVRKAMGVDYSSEEYDQMTIVGTLKIATSNNVRNNIAWQRFTPFGPVGLLPLSDDLSSLAWSTTTENAKRLLTLPVDQFIDELNHALFTDAMQDSMTNKALSFFDKLLECLPMSPPEKPKLQPPYIVGLPSDSRAAFPLAFGYADEYITSRAAVIGDAAHRIHPMAGQGVNLGWYDVKCLTESLENAAREGGDLGSVTYLRDYDTNSQRHNIPVMRVVDVLNRLYRTDFGPLVLLRSVGCNILDKLLPLKDVIVHKASL